MVTLADVESAHRGIAGAIVRTPAAVSETLSEVLGCTVVVKFENEQFVASFKERGARNRLLHLTAAERAAGVVAVSAGNHAQAVARHARLLGVPATIVMPATTPYVKVGRTRALGAEVVLAGDTVAEAMEAGRKIEAAGRCFVHPYDDPLVIAGQGTVALELLEDEPDLDAVVVPVGGGGLLAGMSVVYAARAPHVELVGVQAEAYAATAAALAGSPPGVRGGGTLADGIAVSHPGERTLPLLRANGVDVITVTEAAIEAGVNLFLEIEKVVAEGAGAAGLAALIDHPRRFAGRRVGVVLTGANIDPRTLASIILRGLVHDGRLTRWRVWLDDRPLALSQLTSVIGEAGGNIVEVQHQRLFAVGSVKTTEVEVAVETMDRSHAVAVLESLRGKGYRVEVVPLDQPGG